MPAPGWTFYIGVDDIDRAGAAVTSGGGRIFSGPVEVPGGEFAILVKGTTQQIAEVRKAVQTIEGVTPGAGRISKRVTTGPGCTATTSTSTPSRRGSSPT